MADEAELYNNKLLEMQSYLPFLDDLLLRFEKSRVERTKGKQFEKIKSLREMLVSNKRMKLDNLIKCEEVMLKLKNKVVKTDEKKSCLVEKQSHRVNAPSGFQPTSSESSKVSAQIVSLNFYKENTDKSESKSSKISDSTLGDKTAVKENEAELDVSKRVSQLTMSVGKGNVTPNIPEANDLQLCRAKLKQVVSIGCEDVKSENKSCEIDPSETVKMYEKEIEFVTRNYIPGTLNSDKIISTDHKVNTSNIRVSNQSFKGSEPSASDLCVLKSPKKSSKVEPKLPPSITKKYTRVLRSPSRDSPRGEDVNFVGSRRSGSKGSDRNYVANFSLSGSKYSSSRTHHVGKEMEIPEIDPEILLLNKKRKKLYKKLRRAEKRSQHILSPDKTSKLLYKEFSVTKKIGHSTSISTPKPKRGAKGDKEEGEIDESDEEADNLTDEKVNSTSDSVESKIKISLLKKTATSHNRVESHKQSIFDELSDSSSSTSLNKTQNSKNVDDIREILAPSIILNAKKTESDQNNESSSTNVEETNKCSESNHPKESSDPSMLIKNILSLLEAKTSDKKVSGFYKPLDEKVDDTNNTEQAVEPPVDKENAHEKASKIVESNIEDGIMAALFDETKGVKCDLFNTNSTESAVSKKNLDLENKPQKVIFSTNKSRRISLETYKEKVNSCFNPIDSIGSPTESNLPRIMGASKGLTLKELERFGILQSDESNALVTSIDVEKIEDKNSFIDSMDPQSPDSNSSFKYDNTLSPVPIPLEEPDCLVALSRSVSSTYKIGPDATVVSTLVEDPQMSPWVTPSHKTFDVIKTKSHVYSGFTSNYGRSIEEPFKAVPPSVPRVETNLLHHKPEEDFRNRLPYVPILPSQDLGRTSLQSDLMGSQVSLNNSVTPSGIPKIPEPQKEAEVECYKPPTTPMLGPNTITSFREASQSRFDPRNSYQNDKWQPNQQSPNAWSRHHTNSPQFVDSVFNANNLKEPFFREASRGPSISRDTSVGPKQCDPRRKSDNLGKMNVLPDPSQSPFYQSDSYPSRQPQQDFNDTTSNASQQGNKYFDPREPSLNRFNQREPSHSRFNERDSGQGQFTNRETSVSSYDNQELRQSRCNNREVSQNRFDNREVSQNRFDNREISQIPFINRFDNQETGQTRFNYQFDNRETSQSRFDYRDPSQSRFNNRFDNQETSQSLLNNRFDNRETGQGRFDDREASESRFNNREPSQGRLYDRESIKGQFNQRESNCGDFNEGRFGRLNQDNILYEPFGLDQRQSSFGGLYYDRNIGEDSLRNVYNTDYPQYDMNSGRHDDDQLRFNQYSRDSIINPEVRQGEQYQRSMHRSRSLVREISNEYQYQNDVRLMGTRHFPDLDIDLRKSLEEGTKKYRPRQEYGRSKSVVREIAPFNRHQQKDFEFSANRFARSSSKPKETRKVFERAKSQGRSFQRSKSQGRSTFNDWESKTNFMKSTSSDYGLKNAQNSIQSRVDVLLKTGLKTFNKNLCFKDRESLNSREQNTNVADYPQKTSKYTLPLTRRLSNNTWSPIYNEGVSSPSQSVTSEDSFENNQTSLRYRERCQKSKISTDPRLNRNKNIEAKRSTQDDNSAKRFSFENSSRNNSKGNHKTSERRTENRGGHRDVSRMDSCSQRNHPRYDSKRKDTKSQSSAFLSRSKVFSFKIPKIKKETPVADREIEVKSTVSDKNVSIMAKKGVEKSTDCNKIEMKSSSSKKKDEKINSKQENKSFERKDKNIFNTSEQSAQPKNKLQIDESKESANKNSAPNQEKAYRKNKLREEAKSQDKLIENKNAANILPDLESDKKDERKIGEDQKLKEANEFLISNNDRDESTPNFEQEKNLSHSFADNKSVEDANKLIKATQVADPQSDVNSLPENKTPIAKSDTQPVESQDIHKVETNKMKNTSPINPELTRMTRERAKKLNILGSPSKTLPNTSIDKINELVIPNESLPKKTIKGGLKSHKKVGESQKNEDSMETESKNLFEANKNEECEENKAKKVDFNTNETSKPSNAESEKSESKNDQQVQDIGFTDILDEVRHQIEEYAGGNFDDDSDSLLSLPGKPSELQATEIPEICNVIDHVPIVDVRLDAEKDKHDVQDEVKKNDKSNQITITSESIKAENKFITGVENTVEGIINNTENTEKPAEDNIEKTERMIESDTNINKIECDTHVDCEKKIEADVESDVSGNLKEVGTSQETPALVTENVDENTKNVKSDKDVMSNVLNILTNKMMLQQMLAQEGISDKIRKKLEKLAELESDEEDGNTEPSVETNSSIDKEQSANETKVSSSSPKTQESSLDDDSSQLKTSPEESDGKEKKKKYTRGSRELYMLQEDVRDMFISKEVMAATGHRACSTVQSAKPSKVLPEKTREGIKKSLKPVIKKKKYKKSKLVALKKRQLLRKKKLDDPSTVQTKSQETEEDQSTPDKAALKVYDYNDGSDNSDIDVVSVPKLKPRPKSKQVSFLQNKPLTSKPVTKDCFVELNSMLQVPKDTQKSKEDDSTYLLVKKKNKKVLKGKKRGKIWSSGIIQRKKSNIAIRSKKTNETVDENIVVESLPTPDFTDIKKYCFDKSEKYSCKLCDVEKCVDIVRHFKDCHPHSEIMISRLRARDAELAIQESIATNNTPEKMYTRRRMQCRFCDVFYRGSWLNKLFTHIATNHTGEISHTCTICTREGKSECSDMLDIPPRLKTTATTISGYICSACNFVQISKKNVEKHMNLVHQNDSSGKIIEIKLCNSIKIKRGRLNVEKKIKKNAPCEEQRLTRSLRNKETEAREIAEKIQTDTGDKATQNIECPSISKSPPPKRAKINPEISSRNEEESTSNLDPLNTVETSNAIVTHVEAESNVDNVFISSNPHPVLAIETNPFTANNGKDLDDLFNLKEEAVSAMRESLMDIDLGSSATRQEKNIDERIPSEKGSSPMIIPEVVVKKEPEPTPQADTEKTPSPESSLNTVRIFSETSNEMNIVTLPQHIKQEFDPEQRLEEVNLEMPRIKQEIEEPVIEKNDNVRHSSMPSKMKTIFRVGEFEATKISHEKTNYACLSGECSYSTSLLLLFSHHIDSHHKYATWDGFCSECRHFVPNVNGSFQQALEHLTTHLNEGFASPTNTPSVSTVSAKPSSASTSLLRMPRLQVRPVSDLFAANDKPFAQELATVAPPATIASNATPPPIVHQITVAPNLPPAVASHLGVENLRIQSVVSLKAAAPPTVQPSPQPKSSNKPPAQDAIQKTVRVQPYRCTEGGQKPCNASYFMPEYFKRHVASAHPGLARLPCQVCGPSVSQPLLSLLLHLRVHHSFGLYTCIYCGASVDTQRAVEAHLAAKHPRNKKMAFLRNNLRPVENDKSDELDDRVVLLDLDDSEDQPSAPSQELPEPEVIESAPETILPDKPATPERAAEPESLPMNDTSANIISIDSDDDIPLAQTQAMVRSRKQSLETRDWSEKDQSQSLVKDKTSTESSNVIKHILTATQLYLTFSKLSARERSALYSVGLMGESLFRCGNDNCEYAAKTASGFKDHLTICDMNPGRKRMMCFHCYKTFPKPDVLLEHVRQHGVKRFQCSVCQLCLPSILAITNHMRKRHSANSKVIPVNLMEGDFDKDLFVANPAVSFDKKNKNKPNKVAAQSLAFPSKPAGESQLAYAPEDIDLLPKTPILSVAIHCKVPGCSFSDKVTSNIRRHLLQHSSKVSVPSVTPVNPVPHLETNEMHFDKMANLALSSNIDRPIGRSKTDMKNLIPGNYPKFVAENVRLKCGSKGCEYTSSDEVMLSMHWQSLHAGATDFHCPHCKVNIAEKGRELTVSMITSHMRLHEEELYTCEHCEFLHPQSQNVLKHAVEVHGGGAPRAIRKPAGETPPTKSTGTMEVCSWKCNLCEVRTAFRTEVVTHCKAVHGYKNQFKCGHCQFYHYKRTAVEQHFSAKHPDRTLIVVNGYSKVDSKEDANTDFSPIWWTQRKRASPFVTDNVAPVSPEKEVIPLKKPRIGPLSKQQAISKEKIEEACKTMVKKKSPPKSYGRSLLKGKETPTETVSKAKTVETMPVIVPSKESPSVPLVISNPDDKVDREFGEPAGNFYQCPICKYLTVDDQDMLIHLYEELNYRRWVCQVCGYKSFERSTIVEHSQQLHRLAVALPLPEKPNYEKWVNDCLLSQKRTMPQTSEQGSSKESADPSKPTKPSFDPAQKKRSLDEAELCSKDYSSDEDRLVICERKEDASTECVPEAKQKRRRKVLLSVYQCPHCKHTTKMHIAMVKHIRKVHPGLEGKAVELKPVELQPVENAHDPDTCDLTTKESDEESRDSNFILMCLVCEQTVPSALTSIERHCAKCHPKSEKFQVFPKETIVLKCSLCQRLLKDLPAMNLHFKEFHPIYEMKYENHRLGQPKSKPKAVESSGSNADLKKSLFGCRYCHQSLPHYYGLLNHHLNEHIDESIGIVPLTFADVKATNEVKDITKFEFDDSYFCCITGCNFFDASLKVVISHIRLHYHSYRCNLCYQYFDTFKQYEAHNPQHITLENRPKKEFFYNCLIQDRLSQIYRILLFSYTITTLTMADFISKDLDDEAPDEYIDVSDSPDEIQKSQKSKKVLPSTSTAKSPPLKVRRVARKSTTHVNKPEKGFSFYGTKPSSVEADVLYVGAKEKLPLQELNKVVKLYPKVVVDDIKITP